MARTVMFRDTCLECGRTPRINISEKCRFRRPWRLKGERASIDETENIAVIPCERCEDESVLIIRRCE